MPVPAIFTQSLGVDPITWTNVSSPGQYDTVKVIGLSAASLYVRGGAGQSEIEIPAGTERAFGGLVMRTDRMAERLYGNGADLRVPRFITDELVLQLRSSVGAGPVSLEWS